MRGVALDERELVRRAREGDVAAYGDLVRVHQAAAYRLAALLAGPADAEDIAQTSFVKAHAALPRFRHDAPFGPWLLRIVANEARNTVRGRRRRMARDHRWSQEPPVPQADAEQHLLARERDAALWAALDRLDEADRAVLACRYLMELSVAETAAALRWPRGTVKSRQSRALRRLERLLAGEEVLR